MSAPAVLLFRRDLRLADNPALDAAVYSGRPIYPLYIDAGQSHATRPLGAGSRWWLHHSLAALSAELERRGSYLTIRAGEADTVLPQFVQELGASAVYWEPGREPQERALKQALKEVLRGIDCTVHAGRGNVLFDPAALRTKSGERYRVFTPFWRACQTVAPPREPLPAPGSISTPRNRPQSDPIPRCGHEGIVSKLDRHVGGIWTPGEGGALQRLEAFCASHLLHYEANRDCVESEGTTRLSPHLAFGEISARQIWHYLEEERERRAIAERGAGSVDANVDSLERELAWREFAAHLLALKPDMGDEPLRSEFNAFPWEPSDEMFDAWKAGRTGFPLVDAGMRELHETGYMHNRVRMVAASFLVKDLLIPWQRGERYFWERLVDADLANNATNWQWVAGCGADAAPFFRIFNPTVQAKKFDPHGTYIRRWVPELRAVPDKHIHEPSAAGGVSGHGANYPLPIVEHRTARERALAAFDAMRT